MVVAIYLVPVKYVIYNDPSIVPIDAPANEGIAEALRLATTLEENGADIEMIDVSRLDEGALYRRYLHAVEASVYKKYKIRQVFGSRRRSGSLFGREVPALIAYREADGSPEDVHPNGETGRMVTIAEFLETIKDQYGD